MLDDLSAGRAAPSPADLEPVVRGSVGSAEIDLNGHMNAAHYVSAQIAGFRAALAGIGITETYVAERGMGTFAVEHHVRYLGELREGSDYAVRVQVLGRTEKAIHLRGLLTREPDGAVVNVTEALSLHVDLATRRTTPIPADIEARLDEAAAATAGLLADVEPALSLGRRRRPSPVTGG